MDKILTAEEFWFKSQSGRDEVVTMNMVTLLRQYGEYVRDFTLNVAAKNAILVYKDATLREEIVDPNSIFVLKVSPLLKI